jgi:thiol:disulfide interchange protein DsbD
LVIEARAPRLSEPANGDLDSAAASAAEAAGARRPGIAAALGLAFLGGVLLNLMPCVFPVLSIKVLGLLGHREDPAAGRRHGLFFAAGILVSFWALAGVLLGLRAAGSAVGWGFQLQSPAFVGFLALLFFALGLNFLGVFELGQRLAGHAASAVTKGEGASGSFWSGVLATAVATPCTAPFMGSAIGFATVVAPIVALAVFTALGLGMAAPYVALVYFPAALRRLPRPGPWMETLKQFMAFPLFATVLWLLWVLAAQRGASGVLVVLTALLLAGFAGWLAPRLGRTGSKALKGAGVVLATLSAAGAVLLVLSPTFFDSSVGAESVETAARDGLEWQPWTPELVASLRAEGRPVYVDFTARWCLTCQVNKRVVFGSDRVLEEFEQRNVALVRGDWTNQDPRITAALEEHGRSGVPLNLFYPADATAPPEVLPTVLSPDIVLQVIRSSGDPRSLDPSNQSNSQGDSTI